MNTDNILVMQLPWVESNSDQQFLKILLAFLLAFSLLSVIVARVTLPELTRAEKEIVPPQLARIVMEQKLIVPEPVITPPVEEKKIAEIKKEIVSSEVTSEPLQENNIVKPNTQEKNNADTTAKAISVAKRSGLLAISNELNDLQNTETITANAKAELITSKVESATHGIDVVTTSAEQQYKPINQDELIGSVQKTELQARNAKTQTAATEKAAIADAKRASAGGNGGRASSDISLVFNKNKTGLHSLYERERRKNSSLKGKIIFQLTIEPNGKVSNVKILSSELNNPELEARIIARIKMFLFSPSSGNPVTLDYPVEFIPS